MNKHLKFGLPLAAAIFLVGCGGSSSSDNNGPDTGGLPTTNQKFFDTAQWIIAPTAGTETCFDFDSNGEVDCAVGIWDMKLSLGAGARDSAKFYTNSGPLATGKGGALGNTFNFSWEQLQSMQDTSTAPDGNPLLGPMFLTDSMDNAFASDNAFGGEAFAYVNQKILSKYSVFLISLDNAAAYDANSADIYAVQFVDYYGGANGSTSGHPKVRYAKLSDLTTVKEVSINASTNWAYFDLTTDQTVSKSGNWQLGFNRYNIITNSGDSGSGSVGSFLAQKASGFYDDQGQLLEDKLTDSSLIAQAKTLLTDRSKWTTPTAATDWQKDTLTSALNPEYKGTVMTGFDYGFYLYTGMNESHPAGKHKFVANPQNGVLLRSGEGNSYARVHLTDITDGQYTFDFEVAPVTTP